LDCAVAEFPSALEFLASEELSVTACLIADVHMPAMTGVDLYQHLIERGQAMPTILVTAYPDERVRQRMLAMGVDYLAKPLDEAVLVDCLRCAVARGEGAQSRR
jgi:FixJ family two-component response regulator